MSFCPSEEPEDSLFRKAFQGGVILVDDGQAACRETSKTLTVSYEAVEMEFQILYDAACTIVELLRPGVTENLDSKCRKNLRRQEHFDS